MAHKFELTEDGGVYALRISFDGGGRPLTIPLFPAELWRLASVGAEAAKVADPAAAPPPFAVTFWLPVPDEDDATTRFTVLVDSHPLALEVLAAFRAELVRAFDDYQSRCGEVVAMPHLEYEHFRVENKAASVAEAMSLLRQELIPLVAGEVWDEDYWEKSGFEWGDKLVMHADDFLREYGPALCDVVDQVIADNPDFDYEAEFPGLEKLRRWAAGLSEVGSDAGSE